VVASAATTATKRTSLNARVYIIVDSKNVVIVDASAGAYQQSTTRSMLLVVLALTTQICNDEERAVALLAKYVENHS
jgi:hypothetical protein